MKASLLALLICIGCTTAWAEPCQAAATRVALGAPAGDALAPCTSSLASAAAGANIAAAPLQPLQRVAVRTPPAETVAFIAPAAGRSGAPPGFGAAKAPEPQPKDPPAPDSRGRSLLLVGVALMAGIALRRYGAGRG